MTGLAGVQARMSQIQARMDSMSPRPVQQRSATSGSAPATAASEPSFEDALSAVQKSAGTAGMSVLAQALSASPAAKANAARTATLDPTPSGGSDGSPKADALIAAAKKYLGVPYVWGGESLKEGGFDCSGLVQRAFKDIGMDVSRVASTQEREGRSVSSMSKAKPGDLIFYENNGRAGADHVAIYLGNNKMIAAPKRGDVVKIQNVYGTPSNIRRLLPDQAPTSTAVASTARASETTAVSTTKGTGSIPWAKYHDLFQAAAAKHGVPAKFLGAIATVENDTGHPTRRSPAGAIGVMQFMPGTAKRFGIDPTSPAQSIDGAARYMALHIKQFGTLDLAAAAYNAGEGAVKKYGGIPPYKETQNYVVKVRAAMQRLA